jgi:hypothetical protein
MNLTAHPYTWAAEMAWKQESLGSADRHETGRVRRARRPRRSWRLPRPRRALVLARTATRTATEARTDTSVVARQAWPVVTGLAAR